MSANFKARDMAEQQIANLDKQLLRRKLRTSESPCDTKARVGQRELKAFCSNDYLGLANHPELVAALAEGARLYGVGSGASHLISGHSIAHDLLEKKLAACEEKHIPNARALFFSTGYLANINAITGIARLAEQGEVSIYSAKLNHASLIDGVRLASAQTKAKVTLFDHQHLDLLEKSLAQDAHSLKLLVVDGVFSMDGDIAPIEKLVQIAEQYDALLMVDDAHGFGVLGEHGHGLLEQAGVYSERIIYVGTLGKAAGVSGAFICAAAPFIEWLIQKGRPYIYSTATPPAIAHTLISSLELIEGDEGIARRKQLNQLIQIWRDEMIFQNWEKTPSSTPIQPVILGSNASALAAAKLLDEAGYWIPAIRPPTVPVGSSRLRITFSANHTTNDLRDLIKTLKVIEQGVGNNS
ncbi:MAG: 8-amino-7-oxononanoate synthase [Polynucleobacter sp. 24-46-87]|jgi:8-amino-7-oxononanoate synthase|uniref:aminotransferase class I/II-fold pyridoxal phosphate-dependent enzyme n=1 Tax=unclassified Polynucleobacter TaxID=2640945 RepID=UPI000BDB100B|nr:MULTISPECIES: 8-amino-7-oxononanoate synthase [unclassified Polynucleobacter]OYY21164.1 MAG: 8-amino-7-oxononanoate synthase [Polynucleobacter sp. 35-46-11]OZA16317.1 MAG: 8-amino-7-oxononanoate synthase [Polynucleobacter sp. 24-46-87]OZA78467.1 MAG: 8-amino-7-oxononanoate synthase [Polynucleobacter sp. 39-46-10]